MVKWVERPPQGGSEASLEKIPPNFGALDVKIIIIVLVEGGPEGQPNPDRLYPGQLSAIQSCDER